MRIDRLLLPASFAAAATFAMPVLAQHYDYRDSGPDRYYEDRMRDRNDDQRWNRSERRWDESRRDMDRYGDNRRYSAPYTSRDYDNRGYDSAWRDYNDDRYVRDGREYSGNDPYDRYGRGGGPYSQQWLYEDRYAAENRFQRDRDERYGRGGGPYTQQWLYEDRYANQDRRNWRGDRGGYSAERDTGVDFEDMDVRDRAQWNEHTYRGSANRGLHE